jgi:hypothetical protein
VKPRPGRALASTVDTTMVIVVRAPDHDISLTCAGVEMWDPKAGGSGPAGVADASQLGGTVLGKRYGDEALGLELLCTKSGQGTLAADGAVLPMMGPKTLPASD